MIFLLHALDKDYSVTKTRDVLKEEGYEAKIIRRIEDLESYSNSKEVGAVLVISFRSKVTELGQYLNSLKNHLRTDVPVLVVSSNISNCERRTLTECGASDFLVPASSSPKHAADRILAELFLLYGEQKESAKYQIHGQTKSIRDLISKIKEISTGDYPVLILGETGSGKELVARALHLERGGPFIANNCAALPENLVESELFGHVRGGFTTAFSDRKGMLLTAGEGVAFLDEIGDMPEPIQSKLLRVVQEKTLKRVGEDKEREFHARLVLATNRDLNERRNNKEFRSDFYSRIKTATIQVPPLREHMADIGVLARFFLKEFNIKYSKNLALNSRIIDSLFEIDWRFGNVRDLKNTIEYAVDVTSAQESFLSLNVIDEIVWQRKIEATSFAQYADEVTNLTWAEYKYKVAQEYFLKILKAEGGDRTRAARRADVSRDTLYRYLEKPSTKKKP